MVHPALRDRLQNALLEAMACAKPVIARPVGSVLDMVNGCKNGRTVPVNDVNSLTSIIQEVLSDKNLQKHLGRSARQTVQRKFTLQNEVDVDLRLYRNLG